MTTPAPNRTIGFRSRLEARLGALLERERRAGGAPSATAEGLATEITAHVSRFIDALIEGKPMQQAVLDRAWLAENWSLFDHGAPGPEVGASLRQLGWLERSLRPSHLAGWPLNVAPGDLAQALRRTGDLDALWLASRIESGILSLRDGEFSGDSDEDRHASDLALLVDSDRGNEEKKRALQKWPLLSCARVVASYKMVLADLRKPAIAIDAGKVHHELMTGWSRAAKDGKLFLEPKTDRVELFLPGAENKPAMLNLPLDSKQLSEAFVEAIKEWRSFLGLRHWIALQALFSIQGKREGRVLWKLDDHLDTLGVSKRWREDPENRASVVREVSLLSKMQLVVYRPDGTVRARNNVLLTTSEIDVERGGEWLLEGLELQMHPWLYNGVRDQKTGQLGKHWHPVPLELAKVDHDKFRYALILGLMLPVRWKWAWAQKSADHITLEADKLLDLACIQRSTHNPSRAWIMLESNLAELQRIGLLGHVRWEGEPRTEAARVHLYPADWLLDRTVQGLHPVEKSLAPPLPTKGADLIVWRKARGLTQTQLAALWSVSDRTIRRAEDSPDKPLGRALLDGLRKTLRLELASHPTPAPPEINAALEDEPAKET